MNASNSSQLYPLSALVDAYRATANTLPVYNSDLLPLLREYKALWADHADQGRINACFRSILTGLLRTLVIVPFQYEQAEEFSGDRSLHFTARAAMRFNIDSILTRASRMSDDETANLAWVVENGMPTADLSWWDISRIAGSEGYEFADPSVRHGSMYPRTAGNANGSFMLCYTGVDQLMNSPLGKDFKGHIGVYTLDDIVGMAMTSDAIRGFIINPDTDTHCFVDKAVFTRG